MSSLKEKVQKAIVDIYERDGEVKSSVLVEAAKPVTSPIHEAFEWDNKKAGHEFRLLQARRWIRVVEIKIDDKPERFVHVPIITGQNDPSKLTNSNEGYYKPISIVSQEQNEYEVALRTLLHRLESAHEAYESLKKAVMKCKHTKKKMPDFKKLDRGFKLFETVKTSLEETRSNA